MRFTVLIRLFTGIYGHKRSVSVMYVDIRLLGKLVPAPQHTSLKMNRIYPYLYGRVYTVRFGEIRSQNEGYCLGNWHGHLRGNSRKYKVVDSLRKGSYTVPIILYTVTCVYIRTEHVFNSLRRYTIAPEIHKYRLKKYIFERQIRPDGRCENVLYGSLDDYIRRDTEI